MNVVIKIDNSQCKEYINTLKQMHRSAMPVVVRQTLNDVAFDVQQNTLPEKYKQEFIERNPTFLKAFSGVKRAEGFDLSAMKAEVGITNVGKRGGQAAIGLTQQEFGGEKKKPFIYMTTARAGGNKTMVQRGNYINKIGKIKGKHANVSRHSRKSNFIAAAVMGLKLGKFVLWESKHGETAFLIKGVYFGANNAVSVNVLPIASYKENRELHLAKRPFVHPASLISQKKSEQFFVKNAEKKINKK